MELRSSKRKCQHEKMKEITTDQIGKLLDKEYPGQNNLHIDYFYLMIRTRNVKSDVPTSDTVENVIMNISSDWKKVRSDSAESRNIWNLLFFGEFKKNELSESEREREMRLDTEFRQPLIKELKSVIRKKPKQMASDSEASFHVMITRACRYTDPYYGYLQTVDVDNLDDETEGL